MNKNKIVRESQITPVVLFVFNRYKETVKTLECLKNNNISLLYIFADGPRSNDDAESVQKVRELIDSIDWVETKKIYQKNNLGLSESIQTGLDHVFKLHNTAVVIEDDVCVAPNFYNYMVQNLKHFKHQKQIAGITGLRYPFNRKNLDSSPYDIFFEPRFSSWGWATWKDRWQLIELDKQKVEKYLIANTLDLSKSGQDLPAMIEAVKDGSLSGCWDVYYLISMLKNHQVFVWPKYNMVANNGIGTGTHTSQEVQTWELVWENTLNTPVNLPKSVIKNDMIEKDFLEFFNSNNKRNTQLKKYAKKAVNVLGYDVVRIKRDTAVSPESVDPSDYTTTEGPIEVPCQKESYFYTLNNYIKEGDKVLDVGMGIGYGMNLLSIKAREVRAVDVDKKAVEYCTNNVLGKNPKVKELKHYDGYHLPYKDNYFDVVTCVDVVEHVEDYDTFIDELLRVAKRAVVFATPNRRPEYTNEDGTPMNRWHLREWSYQEFNKIVRKHTKKVDWTFLDGPWEGPFVAKKKVTKDTLVLLPVLLK